MSHLRTGQGVRATGLPARRAGLRRWMGGAVALAVLAGLGLTRFATAGPDAAAPDPLRPTGVAALQGAVSAAPDDPVALQRLGAAYFAEANSTGDPALVTKAQKALTRSHALAPAVPATLVLLGLIAADGHDFVTSQRHARAALALSPGDADALGVLADAQIELGRYDEAARTVAAMVQLRPDIASLARASYLAQLRGDAAGTVVAMEQAVAAGSGSPGDRASVRTLLGDLRLAAGRLPAARSLYLEALRDVARYPGAETGLAKLDAVTGNDAAAAARLRELSLRLPTHETLVLYSDVLTRLGDTAGAAELHAQIRTLERQEAAAGIDTGLESARFEADHAGEPGARPDVVAIATAARAARPSVYGDDAVAWALHRTGASAAALPHARAATRLGTLDAVLWFHRAVIAAELGLLPEARRSLETAFGISEVVSLRDDGAARELAARLGVQVPGRPPPS